jgi:hypothetical protein
MEGRGRHRISTKNRIDSVISGRQVGVGASNYTGTDAYRTGSSAVLSLGK